ncbi:DUF2809 domain-containing protein [Paenibacillus sp. HWE-109]|uniref:ribosomal maturation YjgA family protein n=1 Tax=Paenibacillus sp. HWE-109 TaxID=1306526 RepID=UPI001EE016FB|nr:DUF2809 domain-containing protein [Paenibacillus sp. HWE-109]UKS28795.1 DUF2809 domain-containing protein [Paenibacillus sp. HWE-109]
MSKYGIAVFVTILLGIGSRHFASLLPPVIAIHAGDILWASMVYLGFRFVGYNKSLLWAVGLSVLFSFAIEFSQLYQADWIVALRHTVLGGLILGQGFLKLDLLRYVMGIALAYFLDKVWLFRKGKS